MACSSARTTPGRRIWILIRLLPARRPTINRKWFWIPTIFAATGDPPRITSPTRATFRELTNCRSEKARLWPTTSVDSETGSSAGGSSIRLSRCWTDSLSRRKLDRIAPGTAIPEIPIVLQPIRSSQVQWCWAIRISGSIRPHLSCLPMGRTEIWAAVFIAGLAWRRWTRRYSRARRSPSGPICSSGRNFSMS